jgi:hypothetical protein
VDRAEEFIQLFNRVEKFISDLVGPKNFRPFAQLVDAASASNAAVCANKNDLKQFAMLRNAIIHDADYPSQIIATPSHEALQRFKGIAHQVMEPTPLIPTFATQVHCFTPVDTLPTALSFMRENDFSQVVVRGRDQRLTMITVEGITKWLAGNMKDKNSLSNVILDCVLLLEPPGCFKIMGPDESIFDAADAFTNSIHHEATRLYAIVISENGVDSGQPIGFVTPWDLVYNPNLH